MKKALALVLTVFLSGCVSFTSNNVGNTPKNEIVGTNRPDVLLTVQVFTTYEGVADMQKNAELKRAFEREITGSFYDAGTFGEVSHNVYAPKYKVDVVVRGTYTECKWCNYATYGTLFIVPSWTNDRYQYDVRITDLRTKRTYSHQYYETSVEVKELLLALGMPFTYDNVRDMHKRVFDRIVTQVVQLNFGI
ncbi:MAG: hypothetical protein ACK5N8_04860 [Alphaproteobacteria bacterium]